MKRLGVAVLALIVVILLTSVLLYSGDEKSVKKDAQVKTQKTCQGVCGHDSVNCALEKGSVACIEKHKNGECKGHEAGKCDPEKCSAECKEKCSKECKEKCAQNNMSKCEMSKCDMSKCADKKLDPDKK